MVDGKRETARGKKAGDGEKRGGSLYSLSRPYLLSAICCLLSFSIIAKADEDIKILPAEIKTKTEILKPLETAAGRDEDRSLLDKIVGRLVIPFDIGPMFFLPIMDSSKDLGPNYGIMPIWAMRDKSKQGIGSVMAPSINYNRYLKTSYTFRHYVFPDDKKLLVIRAAYSTVVQREVFIHYFDPELMGTRFRINAEVRHWVNGKASYYGPGPKSLPGNQANFALNLTGEELTCDFPLPSDFYFDFTHAFYSYKISNGPVTALPQVNDLFPEEYAIAAQRKDFMTHKFALIYDDTDHPVLPKIGTYASMSALLSYKSLGSDYTYRTYAAQLKHYYNYKEEGKYVTAVHYLLQKQTGDDLPFYARSTMGESTGLRVAGDGRFIDRSKLLINLEERIRLSRSPLLKFFTELELAPFVDVGTVFSTPSRLRMDNLRTGYGMAFRIVIRPQIVGTADLAFGKEGPNGIVKVGYPF